MRVAILLLYCCGLRRGELLKLRLADIDTDQQVLRIQQTKFNKSRLVPFSSSVGEELQKYLQQRHCQGMPMDPSMPLVWNGRSGRTGGALSPTAISANWFRICRRAGVFDHRGRAPRIHDLRHYPEFQTIPSKLTVAAPNPLFIGVEAALACESTRHSPVAD
jgi:integrase